MKLNSKIILNELYFEDTDFISKFHTLSSDLLSFC